MFCLVVEQAMETDDWTGVDSDDFPLPRSEAPVEQQMPLPELASSYFRDGEGETAREFIRGVVISSRGRGPH